MRTYRRCWTAGLVLIGLIGIAAAVVVAPWEYTAVAVALSAATAGSIRFSIGVNAEQPLRELWSPAGLWAVRAGLAALAVAGYVSAIGVATLALVFVVGSSCPWMVERLRTETAPEAPIVLEVPRVELVEVVADTSPQALSDAELCRAWRRSYTALEQATTVERRVRIVAERQAYLDELDRRRPVEFAEWLEAGPRAAGDPTKYIIRPGDSS